MEFPIKTEDLVSTAVRLLVAEGRVYSVALLAAGQIDLRFRERIHYRGDQMPTDHWTLRIHVRPDLYAQLDEHDLDTASEEIRGACASCAASVHWDRIDTVRVLPAITPDNQWREKAIAWLHGEGINNQGRVRSDNIAPRACDGLLFRSTPEINLYRALKSRGVSFAPLPVFVRGGENYRRIEPDFIIIRDGSMMAVEVDGDTVHTETPVEAHNRTTMLAHEGVHVERVSASECDTADRARVCADRLLAIMDKYAGRMVRA
jgi:hypothetical protein